MCGYMNPNQYPQICKFSHIYSKGVYNQNNIEYNPYLNKRYMNKEALDGLYSKKNSATINTYISSKSLRILRSSSSISPSKH